MERRTLKRRGEGYEGRSSNQRGGLKNRGEDSVNERRTLKRMGGEEVTGGGHLNRAAGSQPSSGGDHAPLTADGLSAT